MTWTDRAREATRKIDPSWQYRLPEQFRDVRPARPAMPQASHLSLPPGGADPFAASIWNGEHGTALRRIR